MRVRFLLLCLLFAAVAGWTGAGAGPAPNHAVRSWQREQGLPQGSANDVVQTRDGYIWVATYAGLARFDGQRFVVFNSSNTPAFRSDGITCLYVDHQGVLWLIDDTGTVCRLVQGAFERVTTFEDRSFEHLAEDEHGDLWMIDHERQLVRLRDRRILPFTIGEADRWTYSLFVQEASTGRLWVLRESTLAYLKDGDAVVVSLPGGEAVRGIGSGARGDLWIATRDRLERWAGGRMLEEIRTPVWPEFVGISSIQELPDGTLAVGTTDSGVRLIGRDGSSKVFDQQNHLADNWVKSLLVDREGSLWIGLANGGLAVIQPVTFQAMNSPDHWAGRPLTSVFAGQKGRLWVGTEGAGYYLFEDQRWTHCNLTAGEDSNLYVWSLDEAPSAALWIGTWGAGVYRKTGDTLERMLPLAKNYQYAPVFARDKDDILWVGAANGIFKVESGQMTRLAGPDDFSNARILCAAVDQDGNPWFGLGGAGLAVLRNGRLDRFRTGDGLLSDFVTGLFFDSDGTLWICTQQPGISILRHGRFFSIPGDDGFAPDGIRYIEEDATGFLWLGTRSGVVRVRKQGLIDRADGKHTVLESRVFGLSDGLPSIESTGTGCLTDGGWLWFPTRGGLVRTRAEDIVANPLPPPVRIEELKIDGRPAALPTAPGPPVRLGPGGGRHVFKFTALSYIAPEYLRFKYRLAGLDAGWIDGGTSRTATYGGLPPGKYTFEVRAANSDGVWSASPARFAFIMLPHFWQTWWFQGAMAALALAALGTSIVKITQRRWRRKVEEVERQRALERERNRIAKDIHDDLGASLTRITLLTRAVRKDLTGDPARSAVHLDQISHAAREVTKSLDEFVWAVNPNHDSLDSVATYVAKFAQDFLGSAGISCRWELPLELPDWPISSEVRHTVFLAYKESLNNIVRHASATRVTITLRAKADSFELSVADNGVGFGAELPVAAPSGGNGLANMRARLIEIGGRLDVESSPDHGSRLTFTVPFERRPS
jgi:signal transduction histidine kinase/ligand-binding sensor domain-containing protein